MKSIPSAFGLALASLVFAAAAAAQTGEGGAAVSPPPSAKKPFFGASLGLKGSVGGNLLTSPDEAPSYTAPFDDGAGGLGGGGGLALEFRALWGHLGLELDVLFEGNKNWCNIEFNNVLKTDWIYHYRTVRLPLLLEGSVENSNVRGSLGIGPEFVVGTGTSTDIEITEGSNAQTDALVAEWRDGFSAKAQTDTMLCIGVGLAFKGWKLDISPDLRYAYDLTQPKKFDDRETVTYDEDVGYGAVSVVGSSTMDMRLLLGIAYDFGFGRF
jgi:hypothetical protein